MENKNPQKNKDDSQHLKYKKPLWIDKNYLSLLTDKVISEITTHYKPQQKEWKEELNSINEFSQILKEYRLDKKDDIFKVYGSDFPYETLKTTVEKYFDKEIRVVSELSEEIETLYFELINIKRFSKKKLESLVTFFNIFKGELKS